MVRKTKQYKREKSNSYIQYDTFYSDENDNLIPFDEKKRETYKKMKLENIELVKYDVEKSENRLNLRITDTEKKILDTLKEKNADFNITEFIRNLILTYDAKLTKEIIKVEYYKNYSEYDRLVKYLGKLENELNNIKNYKITSPELKEDIKNYKKELVKEKNTVLKNLISLENYLEKYSKFVQNAHKFRSKFKIK